MKILITGATGLVGKTLTNKLIDQGHSINILTRDTVKAAQSFRQHKDKISFYPWLINNSLPPEESLKDIDGIIHLMGENIGDKRWSAQQKAKLQSSRIDTTKNLVIAANQHANNLKFFISASAIGIYPANNNQELTEDSSYGTGFLADLCKDWEQASNELNSKVRRVYLRTGVVLDKNGGALKKMLPPFLMGGGGILGDGKQYMSWIHYEDLVDMYIAAIHNQNFSGAINAVSNFPVSNYEFTKALGKAISRPTLFPVPSFAIKTLFGEMSCVILDSQKVISKRHDELKFQFKYPKIDQAFQQIFK